MIDKDSKLSVSKQCEIIGLPRSSYYYERYKAEDKYLEIKGKIIILWNDHPFYGARRIHRQLKKMFYKISRKKVKKLMTEMGIVPIYPKPNLSKPNKQHKKYPYLLRNVEITRNNQVWSTDITYIKLDKGHVYLTAIIDWNSRFVLSWSLSNTLDVDFCLSALDDACRSWGKSEIFNTDQGSQYTSIAFTEKVELQYKMKLSMDGKGRALDNVFIERLWRTVKYEEVFLKSYSTVKELETALEKYFYFYNYERDHMSLDYKTPWEIYSQNDREVLDIAS